MFNAIVDSILWKLENEEGIKVSECKESLEKAGCIVDCLCDSYAVSSVKKHISILNAAMTEVDFEVPELLETTCGDFKLAMQEVVYRILRRTVIDRLRFPILREVKNTQEPETNERQLWFGMSDPAIFSLPSKTQVTRSKAYLSIAGGRIQIMPYAISDATVILEGRIESRDSLELEDFVYGGARQIVTRRIYLLGSKATFLNSTIVGGIFIAAGLKLIFLPKEESKRQSLRKVFSLTGDTGFDTLEGG